MFRKKGKFGRFLPDSDIMHYLRFAVIPVVAILLIAVIILSDARKKREENSFDQVLMTSLAVEGETVAEAETPAATESFAETEPDEETMASVEPETISYDDVDISQYALVQDEVPELSALVHTYCLAREDMDVELLARLYGITELSDAEVEEAREKLELVHASIRSYVNISCYSIEGPEPETYVIFPYFELNYREAETSLPQLTWAYVTKNEDGSCIMTRDVSEPVKKYIARIGEREDVRALIDRVEEARTAAIESDEKLRSIYGGEASEVVIS